MELEEDKTSSGTPLVVKVKFEIPYIFQKDLRVEQAKAIRVTQGETFGTFNSLQQGDSYFDISRLRERLARNI